MMQKQQPRKTVGNAGNVTKRQDFLSEKNNRSSYMAGLADMVTAAYERRGRQMEPGRPAANDSAALEPISPNTRVRRGPRKGNK